MIMVQKFFPVGIRLHFIALFAILSLSKACKEPDGGKSCTRVDFCDRQKQWQHYQEALKNKNEE